MDKIDIKLLTRIYQDSHTGMQSINKVLKKMHDSELKNLIKKQYSMYESMADKCDTIATEMDINLPEKNMFKKLKQSAMLYISLWIDKTQRHIVEMMINGTVMGIVETIKTLTDCEDADEKILSLGAEYKKMQEDFFEKLKKQLSKV